jgi:prophage tail gpP-like protein
MSNEADVDDFERWFDDHSPSRNRNPLVAIERNTDATVEVVREVSQAIADQQAATAELYVDLGLHWDRHHQVMKEINGSLRVIAAAAIFIAVVVLVRGAG